MNKQLNEIIEKWVIMNLKTSCDDPFLIHDDIVDEIIQKHLDIRITTEDLIPLIKASIDTFEVLVVKKK